jgi:hypothetical protein
MKATIKVKIEALVTPILAYRPKNMATHTTRTNKKYTTSSRLQSNIIHLFPFRLFLRYADLRLIINENLANLIKNC